MVAAEQTQPATMHTKYQRTWCYFFGYVLWGMATIWEECGQSIALSFHEIKFSSEEYRCISAKICTSKNSRYTVIKCHVIPP